MMKIFQMQLKLSIDKLGVVADIILCLMTPGNCYSQYLPEAGDKVIISLIDDEKPMLLENTSDSSRIIQQISSGDTLKILEKKQKWFKVKLVGGEIGWLYADPGISKFMLINLGPSRHNDLASERTDKDKDEYWMINASTQYRNIPGTWDIRYYGIEPEFFTSDKFSVSGFFYTGTGSDGHAYVHVPIFGLLVSMTFGFILNEVFDGEFYSKEIFKFLIVENLNYHIRVNRFFMLSPNLNLLGLDVSEAYGPDKALTGLLCNGIGLNARLILGERVSIGGSFGLKHFIDLNRSFGSKGHLGHTVGVNLGIVF